MITLDAMKVKDKAIPAKFMSKITKMNLAKNLYQNTKIARAAQHLRGIEIRDGELFIRAGSIR